MLTVAIAGTAQAATPDGFYEMINTGTTKCADVTGNSTTPGALIQEYDCHTTDNQLWFLVPVGKDGTYYEILNRHSRLCFELPDDSGKNGTPIEQAFCVGFATQQWQLQVEPTFPQPSVQLINRATGKCLDLNNDSADNGTPIQIWDCNATIPAQRWLFE